MKIKIGQEDLLREWIWFVWKRMGSQGSLQGFGKSNRRTELPSIKTGRPRQAQVWGRRLGAQLVCHLDLRMQGQSGKTCLEIG